MHIDDYFNKEYIGLTLDFINEELKRSKQQINAEGSHNGTAINFIIRKYRKDLKVYSKVLLNDLKELSKQTI